MVCVPELSETARTIGFSNAHEEVEFLIDTIGLQVIFYRTGRPELNDGYSMRGTYVFDIDMDGPWAERFVCCLRTGAAIEHDGQRCKLAIEREGEDLTVCLRGPRGGLRASVTSTAVAVSDLPVLEAFDRVQALRSTGT